MNAFSYIGNVRQKCSAFLMCDSKLPFFSKNPFCQLYKCPANQFVNPQNQCVTECLSLVLAQTCTSFCPHLYSVKQFSNICSSACAFTNALLCVSICQYFSPSTHGVECVSSCPNFIQNHTCTTICNGIYAVPPSGPPVCSSTCPFVIIGGMRLCNLYCDFISILNQNRCVSSCDYIMNPVGNQNQCLSSCARCERYCLQSACISECGFALQIGSNFCSSTCMFTFSNGENICLSSCPQIVKVVEDRIQCYFLCKADETYENCLGCPDFAQNNGKTCICSESQNYIINRNQCECKNQTQVLYNYQCNSCPPNSVFVNNYCECGENYSYTKSINQCNCKQNYTNLHNGSCQYCPQYSHFNSITKSCDCGNNIEYSNQNNNCACLENQIFIAFGSCLTCPLQSQNNSCNCQQYAKYIQNINKCLCTDQYIQLSNMSCQNCPQSSTYINSETCQCQLYAYYQIATNECKCNIYFHLVNQSCIQCSTNSIYSNQSCNCKDNQTYSDNENMCICKSAFILLINHSCQLCPNGSITQSNNCDCLQLSYNNTNNQCYCSNLYQVGNICVSLCIGQNPIVYQQYCISACNLYLIDQTNICVSNCGSSIMYLKLQQCVSNCGMNFALQNKTCISNCSYAYISNNNICLAACDSSIDIELLHYSIVQQNCSQPFCSIQNNSSTLSLQTSNQLISFGTYAVYTSFYLLQLNNSKLNITNYVPNSDSYNSMFLNCSQYYNIQIFGNNLNISNGSNLVLLNWNTTQNISYYCIEIKIITITIPINSSFIIFSNYLFNSSQLSILSILISINITNQPGIFCMILNQSYTQAIVTLSNVSIIGTFQSTNSNIGILFNTTSKTNITIISTQLSIYSFASGNKSSLLCFSDSYSTWTFQTFKVFLSNGTTTASGSYAFGGGFHSTNMSFFDFNIFINLSFSNPIIICGALLGYSTDQSRFSFTQSQISGQISLSTVSRNQNCGFFGSLFNATTTFLSASICSSVISQDHTEFNIGFIAGSDAFQLSKSSINITIYSAFTTQDFSCFGLVGVADGTTNVNNSNFWVNLTGFQNVGIFGESNFPISLQQSSVFGFVNGSNSIGLLLGRAQIGSAISITAVNATGSAYFGPGSEWVAAGVGIADYGANFTGVVIFNMSVNTKAVYYGGVLIGAVFRLTTCFYSCVVANISVSGTAAFGMVVGGICTACAQNISSAAVVLFADVSVIGCGQAPCCGNPKDMSWVGYNGVCTNISDGPNITGCMK